MLDENGESRRLCPVSGATGGSWSAKGMILFGHRDGISIVPADGGECSRVVAPGPWPAPTAVFLPDGNRFLYSRGRELDMIAAKLNGDSITTLPIRSTVFAVAPPGYVVVPSRTDALGLDAQRFNPSTLRLEGPAVRVASNVRSRSRQGGGTPRTRFSVPTWRRNTFDDGGIGFAMVGDGERYLLRQSPTGLAVAYVQRWPALLRRADSAGRSAARP